MKTLMQVGLKMLFIHTLCIVTIVLKGTQDEGPGAGRPETVENVRICPSAGLICWLFYQH